MVSANIYSVKHYSKNKKNAIPILYAFAKAETEKMSVL